MNFEKALIREIKVSNRALSDSLFLLLKGGFEFISLAKKFSLTNPSDGGLSEPFTKNKNPNFYNAILLLNKNDFTSVIPSSGGHFSILQLIDIIPKKPHDLNIVYSKIETLLIKKNQNISKNNGVDVLSKKYKIYKNFSILNK